MSPPAAAPAAGLAGRFRAAGAKIRWREEDGGSGRIAHLHDEEARVEPRSSGAHRSVWADPGPVGALVLLLEIERLGAPRQLLALDGPTPGFPKGALVASWGGPVPTGARPVPVDDLVAVARYALA
jgi:hypothetical protein